MKNVPSILAALSCVFFTELPEVSSNQICDAFDQGACPSDTCCKQSICDDEGGTYKCCTDAGIGCSNCPTCVDCTWAEWLDFPYSYPGPRADGSTTTKCKNLVCNGDGMSPEKGYGEKNRKIKFQAGPGGKECDCSDGVCTKASCRDPCPEHCQLDEGWEGWIWEDEEKKCGVRRRTRKVKVEAQHGGDSCEKKYPTDYTEEIFEPCLSATFDSNYTQCGLLHAKKSNCGRHDCIGYMGTNTSVLHGYCKPRRKESEVCGTANAPSPNEQHKVFLGNCTEPNECVNNKCIRRDDENPFKFWQRYGQNLMERISHTGCNLNSSIVKYYMEQEDIPSEAIIQEMYSARPSDPNGYKACTLFHQCLPQNCDIKPDDLLLPVNQKKCLTKEYLKKHECKDKDRIFQIKVLGWGPRQFAPIHDHPLGGCRQKIIKGPGLYERFFLKTQDMISRKSKVLQDDTRRNSSGVYSCYSSLDKTKTDSCQMKNFDKAYITELYTENATINGGTMFIEGYNLMHYVENLNDIDTLHLQFCLGEYRISWWLDQKLEEQKDASGRPSILKSLRDNP